jgi:hypothetical protein
MGRGAAKFMLDVFPGCDKELGIRILHNAVLVSVRGLLDNLVLYGQGTVETLGSPVCPAYGVVYYDWPHEDDMNDITIGLFQVKDHWAHKVTLELIASSVDILRKLAKTDWKDKAISLNFPGIGNGQLGRKAVLPLLHRLPDNVTIWEL